VAPAVALSRAPWTIVVAEVDAAAAAFALPDDVAPALAVWCAATAAAEAAAAFAARTASVRTIDGSFAFWTCVLAASSVGVEAL
jgi:hypothetical protein